MVLNILSEFSYLLYPAIFFGFFAAAAVAMYFRDRPYVRPAFVAIVITGLVVVNLSGIAAPPFVEHHKYTHAQDEEFSTYAAYVEDASGNELRYDNRAISPGGTTITQSQVENNERHDTAIFMLEQAIEHRTTVEANEDKGIEQLRYPPPSISYTWDAHELEQYDEFVAVNIYEERIVFEEDGHEIADHDRTLEARATLGDLENEENEA